MESNPDPAISEAVPLPPWHFHGENIHFEFEAQEDTFRSFLPSGLSIDPEHGPRVQVGFSSMLSYSEGNTVFSPKLRSPIGFKECLIKLCCNLNGSAYWYVPFTWVTEDVSLIRGYLQGFPKRIANIDVSRFQTSHPAFPSRQNGDPLDALISTPCTLSLKGTHIASEELGKEDQRDTLQLPFLLRRRIPDIAKQGEVLVDGFVTPNVTFASESRVWRGTGELRHSSFGSEVARLFVGSSKVCSTSFVGDLTIIGTKRVSDV